MIKPPSILVPNEQNIYKTKRLLDCYSIKEVLVFIEKGKIEKNNQKLHPTKRAVT